MTIKTWVFSFLSVVVAWFGLQLLVMYFTDAAPGAVVVFPDDGFVSALPADFAVVGTGKNWIAIRSDQPNLGKTLYAAGAWVVLPAGLRGVFRFVRDLFCSSQSPQMHWKRAFRQRCREGSQDSAA